MKVLKTIKLFIGGAFVRTESGRIFRVNKHNSEEMYANLCLGSRKDFRNAIVAAKAGHAAWSKKSAYNRSQILYRMAEMAEGKRNEFVEVIQETLGLTAADANQEVTAAIETFVYYAGWCDKYQQVIGAVNPINGPYHNFTTPESVGVVALIDDSKFCFAGLVDHLCSILVGGNSVVALIGNECPAILGPLAEVFATCDLPAGAVNILNGELSELWEVIATHREVRSISYQNTDKETYYALRTASIDNMKRIVPYRKGRLEVDGILNFVEYKTCWHPIGQ